MKKTVTSATSELKLSTISVFKKKKDYVSVASRNPYNFIREAFKVSITSCIFRFTLQTINKTEYDLYGQEKLDWEDEQFDVMVSLGSKILRNPSNQII